MAINSFYNSLSLQKLENTEIFHKFENRFRGNSWYKPLLDYAEDSSRVNRVYIVLGFGFMLLSALLFQYGFSLITSVVGFIYPLYKTLLALEEPNASDRKWLIYWMLYAATNFLETFLFFVNWIPGYWMLKCGFFYWCYAPTENNGSDVVYNYVIQPYFQENQEVISNAINQVVRTAHSVYTDTDAIRENQPVLSSKSRIDIKLE